MEDTTKKKLEKVTGFFKNHVLVTARQHPFSDSDVTTGYIEEQPKDFSGVWGYGGDSISVKINGDKWPAGRVEAVVNGNT
jgi:hypothetical protein